MTETGSEIKGAEKRRRIIEAAWRLVRRHGLRGMTMEALAREAGIAKATLYGQFPDKEAVVAGVIDEMIVDLQRGFDDGLAAPGPVSARVGAALAGKYGIIFQALEGSPHAEEILSEHHRFAACFEAFDQKIAAALAGALAQGGVHDAPQLARIVMAAASGIARSLSGAAEIDAAIRLMCRRLIAPEVGE